MSLNETTFEERQKNLIFLRKLYFWYWLQTQIILIWTSFIVGYMDSLGQFFNNHWYIGLVFLIQAIILIILVTLLPKSQKSPQNIIQWICFVVFITLGYGWLCAEDSNLYAYFASWLIFVIAGAYQFYSWVTIAYLGNLHTLLYMIAPVLVVYGAFLIASDADWIVLSVIMVSCLIFGFYLNYDIRRMVRGNMYIFIQNDPISCSVRLWTETVIVFGRFIEQLFRSLLLQ